MNSDFTDNERGFEEVEREFTQFEGIYAWLCVLIGYLFCRSGGVTATALVALFADLLTVFALIRKKISLKILPISLFALSFIFAFSCVVAPDITDAASLICSFVCYCGALYTAVDNRVRLAGRDLMPLNLLRALAAVKISAFADMFSLMFSRRNKSLKSIGYILLGLCAAFIPTAIVVALLSYDGGFASLLEESFAFLDEFNPASHIGSLLLGAAIACYLFGIYCVNTQKREGADIEKQVSRIEKARVAPALVVASAFVPLFTVYIFFFISQWQYYLSAFSSVLPEGVASYAEYARNGFFELCTVSGINFALISLAALLLKRDTAVEKWVLRVISLIISIMTLVLIGTAMAKMMLYIDRYGLTVKRVLSSWFMVLLFILFVFVIIRQLAPKFKLFTASAYAVLLMVLLLSAFDYKGVIADYNVELYISGSAEGVDVCALTELGDSSVPATVKLARYYEENGMTESNDYDYISRRLEIARRSVSERGIFEFSFAEYRAERAIEEYYEQK